MGVYSRRTRLLTFENFYFWQRDAVEGRAGLLRFVPYMYQGAIVPYMDACVHIWVHAYTRTCTRLRRFLRHTPEASRLYPTHYLLYQVSDSLNPKPQTLNPKP